MRRHEGKVALCAGSATGIGAGCALHLAQEGATVVVGDVNMEGAQKTVDEIVAGGGQALAVEFDIAETESVKALVNRTVEHYGRLDLLHVNATDRKLNLEDFDALSTDVGVFDRIITVSLRGHLLCSKYAIPEMLKLRAGSIVFTSSDAAKYPSVSKMTYHIAKAGLNMLMRHVALRWGKEGIRANCVSPGLTMTENVLRNTTSEWREQQLASVPSERLGSVDDVASLVSFLLSTEAAWINGQVVTVNGGQLMY